MNSLTKMQKLVLLLIFDVALICYTIVRVYEYYSSGEIVGDWRGTSGWIFVCIVLSGYILKEVKKQISEKKNKGKEPKKRVPRKN